MKEVPGNVSEEERREHSAEEIEKEAMAEIKKRVEARFANEPYHNPRHSFESVQKGGEQILDAAERAGISGVDAKSHLVVRFAAAAHDVVIRKVVNMTPGTFGYGQIMRLRGMDDEMPKPVQAVLEGERWQKGNEEASWLEVEHIMDEADPDEKVFTADVRKLIRAAIAATYPDVEFPAPFPSPDDVLVEDRDPETGDVRSAIDLTDFLPKKDGKPAGLKFFQPYLTPASSIEVVAIAVGDLCEGGRVDAEEFRRKGNAEYWETRKLIRERVSNSFSDLSDDPEKRHKEMASAAQDMLIWAQSQVGFLLWQKVRYREMLDTNKAINADPDAGSRFKKEMGKAYSHLDSNIIASFRRSQQLTRDFGDLSNPATYANNQAAEERLRELAGRMDYDLFQLPKNK